MPELCSLHMRRPRPALLILTFVRIAHATSWQCQLVVCGMQMKVRINSADTCAMSDSSGIHQGVCFPFYPPTQPHSTDPGPEAQRTFGHGATTKITQYIKNKRAPLFPTLIPPCGALPLGWGGYTTRETAGRQKNTSCE